MFSKPRSVYGGKYKQELGQVRVWTAPVVLKVGTETYVEVSEGLLGRQRLAMARTLATEGQGHWQLRLQKNIIITIIFMLCPVFFLITIILILKLLYFYFFFSIFTFT